jgi:hypothetical protein
LLSWYEEALPRLRATLGDDGFERAWERGAQITLRQAVDGLSTPLDAAHRRPKPSTTPAGRIEPSGFTAREAEGLAPITVLDRRSSW